MILYDKYLYIITFYPMPIYTDIHITYINKDNNKHKELKNYDIC